MIEATYACLHPFKLGSGLVAAKKSEVKSEFNFFLGKILVCVSHNHRQFINYSYHWTGDSSVRKGRIPVMHSNKTVPKLQ